MDCTESNKKINNGDKKKQSECGVEGVDYITTTCKKCGEKFKYPIENLINVQSMTMRNNFGSNPIHCFSFVCPHCGIPGYIQLKAVAFEIVDDS